MITRSEIAMRDMMTMCKDVVGVIFVILMLVIMYLYSKYRYLPIHIWPRGIFILGKIEIVVFIIWVML